MIGYIDTDNNASLAIHEKFGFGRVGLLPGVAYRYGRWADTVMVQRSLAARSTEPPRFQIGLEASGRKPGM
jgi:L-amino acid N-acyltransferase YncA